jgi:hypothetical protein
MWDDGYFRRLATAEVALCPDGDHVWTYRFFEAALCGAIPLVENVSAHYEGFAYFTTADLMGAKAGWDREMAESNFTRVVERLTVEPDELRRAVLDG